MLAQICFGAIAGDIECVALKKDITMEMELNKGENFSNCFTLEEVPMNSSVQFLVFSNDHVRNKVTLFDMNSASSATYISEYNSDSTASNRFDINVTNRDIAFNIKPTSMLNSDKNINISYLYVDGVGQIIIDLDDIPSTYQAPPRTPPPSGGTCRISGGTGVCENER